MKGLLDFINTPAGVGLLSAVAGGMAGARRGQPISSVGRGLVTGIQGYQGAQQQLRADEENVFAKQYKSLQIQELESKMAQNKAQQAWRAGLPGVMAPKLTGVTDQSRQLAAQQESFGPEAFPALLASAEYADPDAPLNMYYGVDQPAVDEYLRQPASPYADELFKRQVLPENKHQLVERWNQQTGQVEKVWMTPGSADGVVAGIGVPKDAGSTAERKNWEYAQTLPEDQRALFIGANSKGADPSAVATYKYFQTLTPAQQAQMLETMRSPQWRDMGGYQAPVLPGNQLGPAVPKTLAPGELPSTRGAQAAAADIAKIDVERDANRPKAESKISAETDKTARLTNAITKAKEQVGILSAGVAGQATSWIGGSPAKNLEASLATIKANLGFDELQQMRDNSPTGGALGQVAVQEIVYLQSVVSSLDQAQSPQQLRDSLDIILKAKIDSDKRIKAAYDKTYPAKRGDILNQSEIMNVELRDAIASGDTRNARLIRDEMRSMGIKETAAPKNDVKDLPKKPVTNPKYPGFSIVR